jgi:hypothetical protein
MKQSDLDTSTVLIGIAGLFALLSALLFLAAVIKF